MRIAIRAVAFVLVGVLVLVAGASVAAQFSLISNPFQTTTTDRSQPALLKSIQDIGQYHAAVGNFEVILDVEHDTGWVPSFLAGERTLFVAAGTVNAYVDLSGLAGGDLALSDDMESVQVRLPGAELDKPNLDQERTYLFSQQRGLTNRISGAISVKDQSEFYKLAEEKLASAAQESELVQRADENTRAMLIGMFAALAIEVTFIDEAPTE
ncbi:DUF4230 domain-containing protein [Nocardioides limicola]|uniref:DUF4230 domain-containing protein n=1 Tax=Nocardioides limicola TaxID=2803368 RepID=UPI00193BF5F5|nr:DUF4230 domain-containing protein [Nocardioides sp. DJM-14]